MLGPLSYAAKAAQLVPGGNMLFGGIRDAYTAQNPAVLDLVAQKLANPLLTPSNLQSTAPLGSKMLNAVRAGAGGTAAVRNRLLDPAAAR